MKKRYLDLNGSEETFLHLCYYDPYSDSGLCSVKKRCLNLNVFLQTVILIRVLSELV